MILVPADSPIRGDIYHIAFAPPAGPHYAVVVTADTINKNANTVLVASITSKRVNTIYPYEFKLPESLLPKPSKVKCYHLVLVAKAELTYENYIGTISKKEMQGLDVALCKALDLWY